MADLLKTDDTKQKAIKVELPYGTSGEIPIHDAATRTEVVMGDGEGGEVKKYKKGDKVERAPQAKEIPKPKRQKPKKKKKQKPQPSVRGKDILV